MRMEGDYEYISENYFMVTPHSQPSRR